MRILEVEANGGIGEIKLGMKREKVYRILKSSGDLKAPEEWIDYYHIGYDNNLVTFIEMPNLYMDNQFVLFNGIDVFRTEAKSLVRLISDYGKYDESDWELGYSYKFPSLGIGLWRPSIFEYEMINNSSFKEMNEEIQRDEMKYLYFQSVCVYTRDYYKKK